MNPSLVCNEQCIYACGSSPHLIYLFWYLLLAMPRMKSEQHADLRSLGKEAHVTQRGIASLIQSLRDKGTPDHVSRATHARKDLAQTQTPYGQLMTEVEVSFTDPSKRALTIGFQNPMAYVQYQATHSMHYATLLTQALIKHPPPPTNVWRIVLYQDGVDPRDGLTKHKSRHAVVF